MPIVTSPAELGQAALTVADQTLHTVPALTVTTVRNIRLANTTAAERRATVYQVPSGGSAGLDRVIIPNMAIPPYGVLDDDGIHTMEEGAQLIANADDVGVTITVSGAKTVTS